MKLLKSESITAEEAILLIEAEKEYIYPYYTYPTYVVPTYSIPTYTVTTGTLDSVKGAFTSIH